MFVRKLNLVERTSGRGCVGSALLSHLHTHYGISCYDCVDCIVRDKVILHKAWTGFVHNVIAYPDGPDYKHKYGDSTLVPLNRLRGNATWEANLPRCCGLFTFSNATADYLGTITNVPVVAIPHPVDPPRVFFSPDRFFANRERRLVTVGQWMRRLHSICELTTTLPRAVVQAGLEWAEDYAVLKDKCGDLIEVVDYLSEDSYDNLLSENIVFLDLYDVAASNTILQCIVRHTPVLVRDLIGAREYLGNDYPLFFLTIDEASRKANDVLLLMEGHEYLAELPKSHLTPTGFISALASSRLYQSLKYGGLLV